MSTHRKNNISDIVVLHVRDLFAEADDNFVASTAILVLVMAVEFVVTHHPNTNLVVVAVTRYQNL